MVDCRSRDLVDDRHGDGARAGADLGREDLLEALGLCDLFDALEVLRLQCQRTVPETRAGSALP